MTDRVEEADQWPMLQKLRANFENKEAIYLEKGSAARVRVSKVSGLFGGNRVAVADLEHIPAPGLGCGIIWPDPTDPFYGKASTRWTASAAEGYFSFSLYEWSAQVPMAYWSIYSHPELVKQALELASQLSGKLDSMGRYYKIKGLLLSFKHDAM